MEEAVEVALPFNLPYPLSYISPLPFGEVLGKRVLVPLRRKIVIGCVIGRSTLGMNGLKRIVHVVDKRPILVAEDIEFAKWISRRYFYPLGLTLKNFFPPSFFVDTGGVYTVGREDLEEFTEICAYARGKKYGVTKRELYRIFGKDQVERAISQGVLVPSPTPSTERFLRKRVFYLARDGNFALKGKRQRVYSFIKERGGAELKVLRERFGVTRSFVDDMVKDGFLEKKEEEIVYTGFDGYTLEFSGELTVSQRKVVDGILRNAGEHLIFGVTGSGKTICYFEVAKRVLEEGGQVLIIVPEVSLTPQLFSRARSFFGSSELGLYHSYLSERERSLTWFRALDGSLRVVLGTRSSIFLPMRDLKLIVIDEEHDDSLTQDTGLRYDVRELSWFLARRRGVKVIYSSATPSFTTYYRAKRGEVFLHKLPKRFGVESLPQVEVVDMRKEEEIRPHISKKLFEEMERTLSMGKQVIIFHTRRGYSTYAICSKCGYAFKCVNCSLTLVYHRKERRFKCHWCGYEERYLGKCPSCGSESIKFYGVGSEKVEEFLRELFPEAVVERLDSDAVKKRGKLIEILARFYDREIDILVGTNMVVKGHDFPGVFLVGVTGTDNVLNLPDYRSSEKNFQLLTQVAGRPGRRGEGKVIVQTYNPDHYSTRCVLSHDFDSFFEKEMEFRKDLGYPPFADMLVFVVRAKERETAFDESKRLLEEVLKSFPEAKSFGPFPAPVPRIKGFYRTVTILKGDREKLLEVGWFLKHLLSGSSKISLDLYLNPTSLLF